MAHALNPNEAVVHKFVANQVRLSLFSLAYNLGNFLRRLALPESIKRWSLTSVQTRLKTGGGASCQEAVFQLAEVMVSRDMFGEMLEKIGRLPMKTRRQKESSSDSGRSRQGTRLVG